MRYMKLLSVLMHAYSTRSREVFNLTDRSESNQSLTQIRSYPPKNDECLLHEYDARNNSDICAVLSIMSSIERHAVQKFHKYIDEESAPGCT